MKLVDVYFVLYIIISVRKSPRSEKSDLSASGRCHLKNSEKKIIFFFFAGFRVQGMNDISVVPQAENIAGTTRPRVTLAHSQLLKAGPRGQRLTRAQLRRARAWKSDAQHSFAFVTSSTLSLRTDGCLRCCTAPPKVRKRAIG